MKRLLPLLFLLLGLSQAAHATTWYVRSDGGTRYDATYNTSGQCDGKHDAAYPGSGVNQPCAFNDDRWLWSDNYYTTTATCPHWCWVGAGSDTYMIRDCVQYSAPGTPIPGSSGDCRHGYSGPNSGDRFLAIAGDPYSSGMPPPPSGTAGARTKLLGYNYASCTSAGAKTRVHGGYGTGTVMQFGGANYVDVACFDVTDWSSCGRSGQANQCTTSYPLSDYATNGIGTNRNTTNVTFTDINVHGISSSGMIGPTGDGVTVTRVVVSGNASSGWNMDAGDGTTGTGNLHMSQFATILNGCAEVYPLSATITIPNYMLNGGTVGQVGDCTDDSTNIGFGAGYGDGVGTATVVSSPAWLMFIDQSIAAYNTQDGFDLLHLTGNGSSLTITNSYAYGNMGQQIKVGAAGTAYNNVLVGNCNALRQSIPGLPTGYNTNLSDFCRAADVANVISVNDGATTRWLYNTTYTANAVALEVPVNGTCSTSSCVLQYENNILIGFTSNTANGYPSGGSGNNPQPIYFDTVDPMGNAGSSYSYNATWHQKASIPCPDTGNSETHSLCADPQLTDETWHLYGIGNMAPASGSVVIGAGVTIAGITTDINGVRRSSPPTIGAFESPGTPTVATPTASPVAGTYPSTQSVTLSTVTTGATICYTTNGLTPTATTAGTCDAGSTTYSGAITVANTTTIKAIGTLSGDLNSSVATFAYTITPPQVATPTASPVAGTYTSTQSVTLSDSTPGAVICFTTDGTTPTAPTAGTCSGGTTQTYSTAISVATTKTITAIGTLSGDTNSGVFSGLYTINPPATPVETVTGAVKFSGTVKIQ